MLKWLLGSNNSEKPRRPLSSFNYIKVVESGEFDSVPDDVEFRLPTDPKHMARLNQAYPPGYSAEYRHIQVAGTSHRKGDVITFIRGDKRRLQLVKEPHNKFDENAIAVYGECLFRGKPFRAHLGYLPKEVAAELTLHTDIKAALTKMFYKPEDNYDAAGLRIDVLTAYDKNPEEKPYTEGLQTPKTMVDKCQFARKLERLGYIENAIELYELAVNSPRYDEFYPYDRLLIIYRRTKRRDEEIQVTQKAIKLCEKLLKKGERDIDSKLAKYKSRLEKISA